MYSLKQAILLAYEYLSDILTTADYYPIPATLGLWQHVNCRTIFSFCVDDFWVKYYNQEDLNHLQESIGTRYTCKVDMTGRHFLGYTLDWYYALGYADLSMPHYIWQALEKLQYIMGVFPQYSLHPHVEVNWTKKGDRPFAKKGGHFPQTSTKRNQICATSCWHIPVLWSSTQFYHAHGPKWHRLSTDSSH